MVAPMSLTPIRSSRSNRSPRENMDGEFFAFSRDCRRVENAPAATPRPLPEQCILQCTDGLSAQVALRQSPILSAAAQLYCKSNNFQSSPVDKPHTCNPWLRSFGCGFPFCVPCVLSRLTSCFLPQTLKSRRGTPNQPRQICRAARLMSREKATSPNMKALLALMPAERPPYDQSPSLSQPESPDSEASRSPGATAAPGSRSSLKAQDPEAQLPASDIPHDQRTADLR